MFVPAHISNVLLPPILATNPLAVFPMNEQSGNVMHCLQNSAMNGSYVAADLYDDGFRGMKFPFFDGLLAYGNFYSDFIRDNIDHNECSIGVWIKPTLASLSDGNTHVALMFQSNSNNRFRLYQSNNLVFANYVSDGLAYINTFIAINSTKFWGFIVTISVSANGGLGEFKSYCDGSQFDVTRTPVNSFVGNVIGAGCVVGAASISPVNQYLGWNGLLSFWNRPLNANEVASLKYE